MASSIKSPLQCPTDSLIFRTTCSRQNPRTFNVLNILLPSHCPAKISLFNKRRGSLLVVKSDTATENKSVSDDRMLVFVPPHPLIKHWISVLRNEQTPCPIFKNAMAELGRLLIYEASRDWLVFTLESMNSILFTIYSFPCLPLLKLIISFLPLLTNNILLFFGITNYTCNP